MIKAQDFKVKEAYEKLLMNKEIIIFGAGEKGKKCREKLQKHKVKIYAFCDNDTTKKGSYIESVQIIDINSLKGLDEKKYFIVIASMLEEEIRIQLIKNEIFNFVIEEKIF